MMKLVLALLLFSSSAFAQSPGIVFTWSSNGNPGVPACSTTVTTSCLTTFTITDTTSAPVVISSTIPSTVLTYTLTPEPAPGAHTYSLALSGKDQTGKAISSSTVSTTVTVPVPPFTLNPPTGFTAVP